MCLAGCQESLLTRGRAAVLTDGDSNAITMFLVGLDFWSNTELLGQILQGVVGEDERFSNPFQQVRAGEDIMCLLSREYTNRVCPLKKQKPKPASPPGLVQRTLLPRVEDL